MILLWEISRQKTLVGNIYANVVYKLTVYYAKFASFSPRQVHLSPTAQELLNLAPIETFLNNGGSLQSKRQWLQSTILKLSRVCLLIYIKFKFIYQQDNAVALFEEYKHYHISEFEKLLGFSAKCDLVSGQLTKPVVFSLYFWLLPFPQNFRKLRQLGVNLYNMV